MCFGLICGDILIRVNMYYKCSYHKKKTCELEWTIDLFDELIGAGIYMVRWGKAPF